MSTITRGGAIVTPALVLGWDLTQENRNIVHEVIGRGFPDVTLQPAASRSGDLELFFLTAAEAESARALHAAPGALTLDAPEVGAAFTYVVSGPLRVSLDMRGGQRWTLTVPFREVAA